MGDSPNDPLRVAFDCQTLVSQQNPQMGSIWENPANPSYEARIDG